MRQQIWKKTRRKSAGAALIARMENGGDLARAGDLQ
jgi:hypothetical protein